LSALRLWTALGTAPYPQRDDARLHTEYGASAAGEILKLLKQLESDFYKSNAWQIAPSLAEMAAHAKGDFCRLHPELPQEVAEVLAWCYTWDYK
jgi:hypothetical protein